MNLRFYPDINITLLFISSYGPDKRYNKVILEALGVRIDDDDLYSICFVFGPYSFCKDWARAMFVALGLLV